MLKQIFYIIISLLALLVCVFPSSAFEYLVHRTSSFIVVPVEDFVFQFKTTGSDETVTLPIYTGGTYDFNVDWGDTSDDDITAFDDAARIHTYASADTYEVTITGTLIGWSFNTVSTSKDKIYDLKSFGVLDLAGGTGGYAFYQCTNLTVSATDKLKSSTVTILSNTFRGCTALTSIPTGLFDNCTAATSFSGCFRDSALATIPTDLFDKNTLVTTFAACFYTCGITSIPSGLFDNCTEVLGFDSCFLECAITSIPSNLFDSCTKVTSFDGCFRGTEITSIPADLFDNCTKVTSFWITFGEIPELTAIPAGLFDSCTLATGFISCFISDTGINTDLPANLILYNVAIDNCTTMFSGCASMTGDGTAFVDKAEDHGVTTHAGCFTGCTSLPDYNSIPADWGGGGA